MRVPALVCIFWVVAMSASAESEFLPLSSISNLSENEVIRVIVDWREKFPENQLYRVSKEKTLPSSRKYLQILFNLRWDSSLGFYRGREMNVRLENDAYQGEIFSVETDDIRDFFYTFEFRRGGSPTRLEGISREEFEQLKDLFVYGINVPWRDRFVDAGFLKQYIGMVSNYTEGIYIIYMNGPYKDELLTVNTLGSANEYRFSKRIEMLP